MIYDTARRMYKLPLRLGETFAYNAVLSESVQTTPSPTPPTVTTSPYCLRSYVLPYSVLFN